MDLADLRGQARVVLPCVLDLILLHVPQGTGVCHATSQSRARNFAKESDFAHVMLPVRDVYQTVRKSSMRR